MSAPSITEIRASDLERERTVGLLREHWMAGRLTLHELEERSGEAMRAPFVAGLWHAVRELPVFAPPVFVPPPAPPRPSGTPAVVSLVLGLVGGWLLLSSFGLLFVLSLPLSAGAWVTGHRARRRVPKSGPHYGLAVAGQTLGVVGTVAGCLALAGCAAIVV